MPCGKHGFVNTFCNNLFYFSILFSCHLERFPAVFENEPKGPLPFYGEQYHQAILERTARKKRGAPAQKSYTVTNEDGLLQVTPHQIRRVFERRSKTGVLRRSAFREAKLESPDATLPSHPGQGVTMGLITGAIYGILSSMNRRLCRLLSTCKNE